MWVELTKDKLMVHMGATAIPTPFSSLLLLLSASRSESIDKLISNLQVTTDERRALTNTPLDPLLVNVLIDFLYRADHVESLPPLMQPTNKVQSAPDGGSGSGSGSVGVSNSSLSSASASASASTLTSSSSSVSTSILLGIELETFAAVLDGITPLHCAALRGNPAQVWKMKECGR